MARIKKRGLDYFPINTDFIHDRAVRRLMKREGDASLAILLEVLSYIYAGEGYYVRADRLFYEDLSAGLYEKSADDVERIIRLAVEYGLFDAGLFERCSILTSAEIQRQYLFSTRRRSVSTLHDGYCLLEPEERADKRREERPDHQPETPVCHQPEESSDNCSRAASVPADATEMVENVTLTPENVTSGTHSIVQNSIAQNSTAEQRKEYPHFHSPLQKSGERAVPACEGGGEEISSANACGKETSSDRQAQWTREGIDALCPPADGTKRNYAGLLYNLRSYDIPPSEQYAIIRKSNFGAIGDPVWKALATLRGCGGKIKLPGRYLLSVVNRRELRI